MLLVGAAFAFSQRFTNAALKESSHPEAMHVEMMSPSFWRHDHTKRPGWRQSGDSFTNSLLPGLGASTCGAIKANDVPPRSQVDLRPERRSVGSARRGAEWSEAKNPWRLAVTNLRLARLTHFPGYGLALSKKLYA